MPITTLFAVSLFITGFLLGAFFAALWMRAKMVEIEGARQVAVASLTSAQAAAGRLPDSLQSAADAAVRTSQQAFLEMAKSTLETVRAEMAGDMAQRQTAIEGVMKPLADSVAKLDTQIRDLETARERAFGGLEQQLQTLAQGEAELRKETATLVTALRAPQVRGRWGEITLRRVAELAGMVERCDFFEQETHDTGEGRIRPDMTVRLPGNRTIVVDAKVPLTAYLEASTAASDAERHTALLRHSQQVAKHVEMLSGKSYWSQFQPAPEFVVLFIPGDHFFSAALEQKPTLVEDAARQKILVATPTTLIAILKGVAYGWRQERLAQNAEEIRQLTAELFERIVTMLSHFKDVGRTLHKSVNSFNDCVASLQSRLYPSLRRMRELGVTTAEEPEPPQTIDVVPTEPSLFESS